MHNLLMSRVPSLHGKKEVVIGSKVSAAEFNALQDICNAEDRTMSYLVRNFVLRGLAAYYKDGQVRLPEAEERIIERGKIPDPKKKGILATEIELNAGRKRKLG